MKKRCNGCCSLCPHGELIETGYGTFYACDIYDDTEEQYEECTEDDE